jgi:immune inhibitor A
MAAAAALVMGIACVRAAEAAVPTHGNLRLLVILASFADRPLAEPRTHFTGAEDALVDRLVAFYAEASAGRLRIVPHVGAPVVTLPDGRARYVQHSPTLAADAIRAFASAPLADDDRKALADADAVVVFFPGPGRESYMHPGESGDPWSNYTEVLPPVAGVAEACVVASNEYDPFSSFGVLCHEFGHLLGLPELYAPGGAVQEGIGKWGLMGQGTWVGHGDQPTGLDGWSKLHLGWVDALPIERTTLGVRVPAVGDEPLVVKIPAVVGKAEEFYLLENRRQTGVDAGLPGEGLLVWHVDESVTGFRTGQSNVRHKLLHLVEADGRGDLDRGTKQGGNRGDASDPWSGPPRWRGRLAGALALAAAAVVALALYLALRTRRVIEAIAHASFGAAMAAALLWTAGRLAGGPVCGPRTPGMAPYGGAPGRVELRGFSPPGPVMQVDVLIAPTDPAPSATP